MALSTYTNKNRLVGTPSVKSSASSSKPLFDEGDQFFDLYNSLGADYQKQLDPILHYNYKPSFSDRWAAFWGNRNNEDAYRESLQQQARLTALQLAGDEFQNNYNSDAARAARSRAAGINPDIAGEVDGEPASGAEQPATPVGTDFLKPVVGMSTLPDMFGLVNSTLSSVISFGKIFSEIGLNKTNRGNVEINSLEKALSVVADIASSVDPASISDIIENGVFKPEKSETDLEAAVTSAVYDGFKDYSHEARKHLMRAWRIKKNDPETWSRFYQKKSKAVTDRSQSIVDENIHGAFNLGSKVVEASNNANINHMMRAAKIDFEIMSAQKELQQIAIDNDTEYQEFLFRHHYPSTMARSELNTYLQNIREIEYKESVVKAQKEWLDELIGLKKLSPKDPRISWLINGVINGQYSPLNSIQGHIGGKFLGAGYGESFPISPYGISKNLTVGEDGDYNNSGVTDYHFPRK